MARIASVVAVFHGIDDVALTILFLIYFFCFLSSFLYRTKKTTILIYNNLFNFLEQSIIMLSMSNHVIIREKMKIPSNL